MRVSGRLCWIAWASTLPVAGCSLLVPIDAAVSAGVFSASDASSPGTPDGSGAVGSAGSAQDGSPDAEPPNLLSNGDFEATGGCGRAWTSDGLLSREATAGRDGSAACRVCATSSELFVLDHWVPVGAPIALGQTFEARAWVRVESGVRLIELRLREFDEAEAYVDASGTQPQSVDTSWRELVVRRTMTTSGRLNPSFFLQGFAARDCAFVDDLRVRRID